MQTRSTTEIVEFRHPFVIRSNPGAMPAGRYVLHVEEEMLEGVSFAAWRRTNMTIMREHPPAGHLREALPVLPAEIDAARAADARSAS